MNHHAEPKVRIKKQPGGVVQALIGIKELEAGGHEVVWNCAVMQRMRDAGVPIMGMISIQGVKHGTLTYTFDDCFMEHKYEWTPGANSPDEDPAAGL